MIPDLSIYFKPISTEVSTLINQAKQAKVGKLAEYVQIYTSPDNFPDWHKAKLAIIGICEDRESNNIGSSQAPDFIRKQLYQLYATGQFSQTIVDLGNIQAGFTINDTYFAVSNTIKELTKKNLSTVVIGGTQNLTFALYKAFESLEQVVNLTCIDSSFDLGTNKNNYINQSYLSQIILHQPSFLFNYSNLGYQTYFVPSYEIDLLEKLFFDVYRLGKCQTSLEEVEPLIRNADIVSFDVSAVRQSDAPGCNNTTSNGFYGEEFCQLSRYAGFSDKTSVVGFFETNPTLDIRDQTSLLVAQAIWYFIDGFNSRKNEIPVSGSSEFNKYIVALNQSPEHEIIFFKSKKTARWWMSVPFPPDKKLKFERHHIVPCSYNDYQTAINNELPDRWWQTYQKLI
jgi:arginase family enzyme